MPAERMRSRNPAGHAGLINNVVALASSLAAFLGTRLSLFARESKGALLHLLLLAGAVVAGIILTVLGYLFLVVSVIFGIAHVTGVSWIWISFGAAAVHLLVAAGCGFFAAKQVKQPMFQVTMEELQKDREWLRNLDRQERSKS